MNPASDRAVGPARRRSPRLAAALTLALAAPLVAGLAPAAQASPAAAPRLSFFAGTGSPGQPILGPATSSPIWGPPGTTLDDAGNLYVANDNMNRVHKITPSGTMSTVAGTGVRGDAVPGPATASPLKQPSSVALDSHGNLYIADFYGYRVHKVTPDGQLSFFAGNGIQGGAVEGPALSSPLNPRAITVDSQDNVYIGDPAYDRIVKVTPAGALTYFAGNGTNWYPSEGRATSVAVPGTVGLAVDADDNVYVADTVGGYVEKIDQAGNLTFVAGNGGRGPAVAGNARATSLYNPGAVAVDPSGNVFIADSGNHRVEKVDPAGNLTFVAGTGTAGRAVEGPPTSSPLNYPVSVSVDPSGSLYIGDQLNYRIHKVAVADVPSAPTGLAAAPGVRSVTLTITPGADGGAPITGYEVSTDGGPFTSLPTSPDTAGTRTATVPGLGNDELHSFVVRAVNAMGTSESSPSAAATTFALPSAPLDVAAARGDRSVQLTIVPGADGGSPVTGYEVAVDNGPWAPLTTSTGPAGARTGEVFGLTNGTTYTFAIRAINAVGNGAGTTAVTATPRTTPSAPSGLTAVPGDGSATVRFTEGADGGSPISGYEVSVDGGSWNALVTAPSGNGERTGTVGGLVNGSTADIVVRAVNAAGPGAATSPVSVLPTSPAFEPIDTAYASIGGPGSPLGTRVGASIPVGDGRAQQFQKGWIYWSAATGAHEVHGDILADYLRQGGPTGPLGFPTSDETPAVNGGRVSTFTGGTSFWTPRTGAHALEGATLRRYAALGGPAGLLGYPTTGVTRTPDGVGRVTSFTGGNVYWSSATGAHEVHGAILAHYRTLGGPSGPLGYPTTDETPTPDRIGRFNHFSRASSIYWTPATGAHEVHGEIRKKWAAMGWERGIAGYPTSDETVIANGRSTRFSKSNLAIYWSPRTGTHEVHGAIRWDYVNRAGGPAGRLGFPVTDEYATRTGRASRFLNGVLGWTQR